MKAVVQRVKSANVSVEGDKVSEIGKGLLIFVGVSKRDEIIDVTLLARKIAKLRIFSDDNNKMNLCLTETGGEALVVSNFTLLADCRHGLRPSFINAAEPKKAEAFYEFFVSELIENGVGSVKTGVFGADMAIALINDGPVTITLDTEEIG